MWIPGLAKDWDGSPVGTHLFTFFRFSLKNLLNYVLPSSHCETKIEYSLYFPAVLPVNLNGYCCKFDTPKAAARFYHTRFPYSEARLPNKPHQVSSEAYKNISQRFKRGRQHGTFITCILGFIYGGKETPEGIIMSFLCFKYIVTWQSGVRRMESRRKQCEYSN